MRNGFFRLLGIGKKKEATLSVAQNIVDAACVPNQAHSEFMQNVVARSQEECPCCRLPKRNEEWNGRPATWCQGCGLNFAWASNVDWFSNLTARRQQVYDLRLDNGLSAYLPVGCKPMVGGAKSAKPNFGFHLPTGMTGEAYVKSLEPERKRTKRDGKGRFAGDK